VRVNGNERGQMFEKDKSNSYSTKIGGLTFLYTNADCLYNKILELETLININNPDVILITEINSKNKGSDTNWVPKLKNYVSQVDRSGRGVAVFVKTIGNSVFYDDKVYDYRPSIFGSVTVGKEKMEYGVVYRSPNNSSEDNEKLNTCVSTFCEKQGRKVIVGDFNYPGINWEEETCVGGLETQEFKFLNTIQETFMQQMVDKPTHYRAEQKANILDLVLVDKVDNISKIEHHPPIGKSHHSVLTFKYTFNEPNVVNKSKGKKYMMKKGNYDGIRKEFGSIYWKTALANKDIDEIWKTIKDKLNELQEKIYPF